jgi:cysteine desulfurase / selenocysteine lyase
MKKKTKIYLDQAATSFPKPESVYRETDRFARRVGIGNDRGFYRESREVAEIIERARAGVADLLNCRGEDIVFTTGTTESLNTLLLGLLREGDRVLISPFEHNALTRPLAWLAERRGVNVVRLEGTLPEGIDLEKLEKALAVPTRLCAVNQVSNVFGLAAPIGEIGEILKKYPETIFAVDGAQSLGTCPIDVEAAGIDFLAFSGHKGLLGPTGTGGFFIRNRLVELVDPLKFGGTGIISPGKIFLDRLPHKYEVGTQNSWGIAGLLAGVEYVRERTVDSIHRRIEDLTRRAVKGLSGIDGITLFLPDPALHHGIVSFNLAGLSPRETASLLDRTFDIKVRDGIHCAPDAHRTAGTFPQGTVRASFGDFNTGEEVDCLCEAVAELAENFSGLAS